MLQNEINECDAFRGETMKQMTFTASEHQIQEKSREMCI